MVLLDSEGIDAVRGEGLDDNQIFTLTVLLASVLIYNSAGVPTRHDLNGLEYPLVSLDRFFFMKCLLARVCLGPYGVNRLKVGLYSKGWFSLATESEFVVGVVRALMT